MSLYRFQYYFSGFLVRQEALLEQETEVLDMKRKLHKSGRGSQLGVFYV